MNRFLVIDGNSLINRAFYGTQNSFMRNADGLYTGALFGFLNIYLKNADEIRPTHVAVAFDRKEPTFRHKAYGAYKGTRKPMPEELKAQIPVLKELLDAMNITRIELPGFEADDILGTLSRLDPEHTETVILTGDRDSLQLINDTTKVALLKNAGTVMCDTDWIRGEYGVEPLQMIEIKALMGDSSDNIPGIPGVGEKTAVSLIQQYGSVDGLYAHADEITKPALKAKVTDNRDSAYLSKMLGTINTSVPLNISLNDCSVKEYNNTALSELLERLEFRQFRQRLCREEPQVEDEELSLFSYASEEKKIVYSKDQDLFEKEGTTDKLYIYTDSDCTLLYKGFGTVLEINSDLSDISDGIKKSLEDGQTGKILFKAKEFILRAFSAGICFDGLVCDLSIASYLLDSMRKCDDFSQVMRFILNKNVPAGPMDMKDAYDASEKLLEEAGLLKLYREIELPLVPVLARMEFAGFRVNPKVLEEEGAEMEKRISDLKTEIFGYAGRSFNINSPKQLGSVLFEEMKLPGGKKTKTGYSTDADALEAIEEIHPVISLILEYRTNTKLKSTYIDGLLGVMSEEGRVHSTFHQTVTATGRLSSSEPNLQNIPVRSELGKQIRKAFVPEDDNHILIDADYSQIELRILAAMSGDETMTMAFNNGFDIHTITAAQINKVNFEDVTPQMRSSAKAVNFGIVYGISEFGLARDTGISRYEAKKYMEMYFARYPAVMAFRKELIEDAKRTGYARTLYGRRRPMPELNASKYMTRQFGERVAVNMPIQGTSADIIKLAMVRIDRLLRENALKARLILQVHDELLIDAPKEEAERVTALLREAMENAAVLSVPLSASVSSSDVSWYYCK